MNNKTVMRHALISLLILTFVGCAHRERATPQGEITAPSSWPMYQRTADHNVGVVPSEGSRTWTYAAGAKINSGLAIVGTSVFLDTFDGRIVALDIATGKPRWIATTDNIVMSTPVVAHGIVVVGTGRSGPMNMPNAAFVYDPVINASPDEVWGRPEGDHIIALDASTGKNLWRYRTMGEDMPSPTIVGNMVVFANGDQHAYGLSLKDGTPIWRVTLNGIATMASANALNGTVFVSDSDLAHNTSETLAIQAANGNVRWRVPCGNSDAAPTIGDGIVFLADTSEQKVGSGFFGHGIVTAVDILTGRKRWQYVDPHPGPFTSASSSERAIAGTFANGMYFQSIPTSHSLLAFNPKTGRVLWRYALTAPAKMSPVIDHGKVYIGDINGTFYDVDASTGTLRHEMRYRQPFTTAPPIVIGRDALLVVGDSVQRAALP